MISCYEKGWPEKYQKPLELQPYSDDGGAWGQAAGFIVPRKDSGDEALAYYGLCYSTAFSLRTFAPRVATMSKPPTVSSNAHTGAVGTAAPCTWNSISVPFTVPVAKFAEETFTIPSYATFHVPVLMTSMVGAPKLAKLELVKMPPK